MNVDEAVRRIEESIQRERSQVASTFVCQPEFNIDARLASLELTRSLNYYWWLSDISRKKEDISTFLTIARGFNSAVSMFMSEQIDNEGVPNVPSTQESKRWADSVLFALGSLQVAARTIKLLRAGMIEFVDGSSERIRFQTIGDAGIAEDDDFEAHQWMSAQIIGSDEEEYNALKMDRKRIRRLLRKNVYVFNEHYIGYDSTPELDEYYERRAILHARSSNRFMGISPDVEFGGIPFGIFGAATTSVVGWALKHIAFATELYLMNPGLDIRNLLVPWSPLQWKVDSISTKFNIDKEIANKVCNLFVGRRDLFARYSCVHDSPFPLFVQAARSHILFSVASAQLLPYDLLRRRLSEVYPSDYFRNVNEREIWFREDLRWVLPAKRIHFAEHPILLRKDGKTLTDIDALILVKSTGTLGVFQLKWQEPYGGDLREHRNLLSNLVSTANKWIQVVHDWVSERGPQTLVDLAKFEGEGTKIRRIVYFVMGRHHCRFSQSKADQRAVWCSWPQFVRAMASIGITEDPILALADYFQEQVDRMSKANEYLAYSLRLRDFTIETNCRVQD